MRIAAVHLPSIRIELARARLSDEGTSARNEKRAPLAVVVARPGGAVKDERSLLGGTRLDAVSREARACGVRAGDTIAAARAKEASLLVRVVAEHDVHAVLASVAEAALAFGRTTSIDEARDVVCADVTGCGHLFGPGGSGGSDRAPSGVGEAALGIALRDRVRAMHHAARVAIADGPRVATAIARYTRARSGDRARARPPIVVPEGENAAAVRALPLDALPIDARSIAWLSKLGLSRVGDLQTLPKRGLATRLGAVHAEVMALLAGDDTAPLAPYVPPDLPEERAELEYGIEGTEPLLFVAKMLCDRFAARLAGRAMAAMRVAIDLSLDKAVARESDDSDEAVPAKTSLELTFPAPLSTAAELLAVVRARVESFTIPAPILAVTLRAIELARKESRALDLFVAEAKADRALPRLVGELAADLGVDRVGTLRLANTWVPESRTELAPFGTRASSPPGVSLESIAPEPSRILAVPFDARGFEPVRLLARVEAVEWWRSNGSSCGPRSALRADVPSGIAARDLVAAWDGERARMAWLAIDHGSGAALVRGWMD